MEKMVGRGSNVYREQHLKVIDDDDDDDTTDVTLIVLDGST